MKEIKILRIQFDTEIHPQEISAFRGAVIAQVGREDTLLFHNHLDDRKYRYRYPLIQYKRIQKKAAIVCLEEGVEEIHKFFEKPTWELCLNGKAHTLRLSQLDLKQFTVQVTDKPFRYRLHRWLALDAKKYGEYRQLAGLADQLHYLERILTGNILAWAKGIHWYVDQPISLKILDKPAGHFVKVKEQRMLALEVDFACNVFIPNYLGLGRKVSLGFGVVRELKKPREDDSAESV